jgi:hypothetical protein
VNEFLPLRTSKASPSSLAAHEALCFSHDPHMKVLPRAVVLSLGALSATVALQAQFVDTFDSINPAWTTDRFEPAGFQSVSFLGDNRLQITVDSADFAGPNSFYDTEGRQRPSGLLSPVWTVSADLYVGANFVPTTGSALMRTDLWTRDNNGTESLAQYPILGLTNASPTDALNADALDRSLRFRAWDEDSVNGWVDLTVPGGITTDAWHNLAITSTGSAFEFRVDGNLLYTDSTYSDVGAEKLQTVFLEAYNFGQLANDETISYNVYWDNLQAIPEPGTYAAVLGIISLGIVAFRRRRMARCAA